MRFGFFLPIALLIAGCSSAEATTTTGGDELVAPAVSGLYLESIPSRDEGRIWQLALRPDGSFSMNVQGAYDCEHLECPTTSALGQLGWTRVSGMWKTIAASSDIELRPDRAEPFRLALTLGATTLAAKGSLAGKDIAGEMPIVALYGKDHPTEKQLEGTWIVDSAPDRDGREPCLDGSPIDVRETKHFVAFDAKARTFREWTDGKAIASGPFSLGATPAGKGVLVTEVQQIPTAATLDSLDGDAARLVVADGSTLRLKRQ